MTLFEAIDARRERWDVLEHPFYRRWSAGELSRSELALYAGQYRHAVVALAAASTSAARAARDRQARAALQAHAREEAEHVALWDQFASALGQDEPGVPTPETQRCVSAWIGDCDRDVWASLAALYAIESSQPQIAEVKRDGLIGHYGFESSSRATEYFDVHATRDHEHAAQHRALLEHPATEAHVERLAASAEDALAANWLLLDGVERLCEAPSAAGREG